MTSDKAIVRQHAERIAGVSRTWFEWSLEGSALLKTLVVEVEFDTDPNNPQCRRNVLDAIKDTVRGVLENDTTMIVSDLKIVPKLTS
jgi:hypothetical protein